MNNLPTPLAISFLSPDPVSPNVLVCTLCPDHERSRLNTDRMTWCLFWGLLLIGTGSWIPFLVFRHSYFSAYLVSGGLSEAFWLVLTWLETLFGIWRSSQAAHLWPGTRCLWLRMVGSSGGCHICLSVGRHPPKSSHLSLVTVCFLRFFSTSLLYVVKPVSFRPLFSSPFSS